MKSFESWGRYPKVDHQTVRAVDWSSSAFPVVTPGQSVLPYGIGRSYGDSCLNDSNTLLSSRFMDHFLNFDRENGTLRCEAGLTLDKILDLIVPAGFFIPVSPGSRFVTVGGAIANDIHGKNHHGAGSFGNHVLQFELLRSDGTRMICSQTENPEFFIATIGGLGLTGLITWAEFSLRPICSSRIVQEVIRYSTLDEFFKLSEESAPNFEYTVSWIDCLSQGKNLGRGLFIRGNHEQNLQKTRRNPLSAPKRWRLPSVPLDLPSFTLNRQSIRAFNTLYYWKNWRRKTQSVTHYEPFFYPLDSIGSWNRIYGSRGFFEYQCVVPYTDGGSAIAEILKTIADEGSGSFLAVLKTFGTIPSRGLLSFPRPGVTLGLDFSNRGKRTLELFKRLDTIVASVNGALYPAKDARMSQEMFELSFPRLSEFHKFKDPLFSSSFWRRVQP